MFDLNGAGSLSGAIKESNKLKELGRHEEAIAIYNMILKEDSEQVFALKKMGMLYLKMGKVGQAIEYLGKAVELEPNDLDVQNMLEEAIERLEE